MRSPGPSVRAFTDPRTLRQSRREEMEAFLNWRHLGIFKSQWDKMDDCERQTDLKRRQRASRKLLRR